MLILWAQSLVATVSLFSKVCLNLIQARDNDFIISGYRPAARSIQKSLKSLIQLHNETINIHSHLFGALLFLALPFIVCFDLFTHHSIGYSKDILVFSTFFFGVAVCFFLSAGFHTFNSYSERIHKQGNQLDYLGIVILMWGSSIPFIFYGFYCDQKLQTLYWSIVSVLAIFCIAATFTPHFEHPHLRPWRAAIYGCLGFSSVSPIIHGLVLYGWTIQKKRMGLDWTLLMTALNLIDAAIYVYRIPERWSPIKFDIFGNSHQIFHIIVLFAGLAHMFGLLGAFNYVHKTDNQCH
ncbi:mPR-like GPCR protein [Cadophora sp. MPI-SDFR-AT-0126]|nr:mPR-like GPCR protein [Leotiomycetes sp. MPI-SDFR-AT-0126]